ncbi:Uncharacterised protein [Mycobacteroides abscessus]|nr:Uncharacterised protein [Mycobacteroides abscessus]
MSVSCATWRRHSRSSSNSAWSYSPVSRTFACPARARRVPRAPASSGQSPSRKRVRRRVARPPGLRERANESSRCSRARVMPT